MVFWLLDPLNECELVLPPQNKSTYRTTEGNLEWDNMIEDRQAGQVCSTWHYLIQWREAERQVPETSGLGA